MSRTSNTESTPDPETPLQLAARLKGSPWARTILTSLFVFFMLAAAHLFMVVINAAEANIASPSPSNGIEARIFSDETLVVEIEKALEKAHDPASIATLETALAAAEAGEPVVVRSLPVTSFLIYAALGLCFFGILCIWLTSRIKSDAGQSILGIFGGNLIWTGGIEYGLLLASRSLGIGKAVTVVDGQLVAVYGEYILLKHTWGVLLLVMVYLLFLESSRCPIFLWWRKKVPTMRGPVVSGKISNYGPRTAFQYATTVWGFYLLLLWAYDASAFGVYSLTTKAILLFSLAGTVYCMVQLHRQSGWGPALRYSIAAVCVGWTAIEILAKWGVMKEPWLLLDPQTALFFFGGLGLGTWGLWRGAQRRKRLLSAHAPEGRCPMHGITSAAQAAVSRAEEMGRRSVDTFAPPAS